jgi:hypothetical protein
MRRSALQQAGFLQANFHMVLDHSLWIRIASLSPILHVPQFWAVERTHQDAKTTAQAPKFVEEAFVLIPMLEKDPAFQDIFRQYRQQIYAGLHAYAGRRFIDSGHSACGSTPQKALRLAPGALRYWFKLLQAPLAALLMPLAIVPRARRKAQLEMRLEVNEQGSLGWKPGFPGVEAMPDLGLPWSVVTPSYNQAQSWRDPSNPSGAGLRLDFILDSGSTTAA